MHLITERPTGGTIWEEKVTEEQRKVWGENTFNSVWLEKGVETDLTFDKSVFKDGTADNEEVKSVEEGDHVALQEKLCNSTRREHRRA